MLRDHINRVPKQTGRVITVDLTNEPIIEVLRLDGAVIRVSVGEYPASFRWPKEGEIWSMTEENGVWILGGRVEDPDDTLQALWLAPGETFVRGDTIYIEGGIQNVGGSQAVLIDGTPNIGDAPIWNGVGWAPGASGGGGGAPSGVAGGDLGGVYPNPTVIKAQAGFTVGGFGVVLTNDTRLPTQGENDALVGTSGIASATNRYVTEGDVRMADSRAPSGAAGGVLAGTYPNPSFAADMATQAELDAHKTSADHDGRYLVSPALTGTPTAPTAGAGTNTTQIATTAFVTNAVSTGSAGATSRGFGFMMGE